MTRWFPSLWLIGCAADHDLAAGRTSGEFDAPEVASGPLTLIVTPTVDAVLADGSLRALPARLEDPPFDAEIALELPVPFALAGAISATPSAPTYRAEVPGSTGPVLATVHLRSSEVEGAERVTTGENGDFRVSVVEARYTVTVAPDDPRAPLSTFQLDLRPDAPLDLALERGVAVWGRVTEGGHPKPGARVHATTAEGVLGAAATTDAEGWYQLQVQPGPFTLRTLGADDGFDPVLASGPLSVGEQGARVDFTYAGRRLHDLAARAVGPDGEGLAGVDYRLRSVELFDYPEGGASVEVTGRADNRGNVVTRAAPGVWTLEILPDRDLPVSGLRVGPFEILDDLALDIDPLPELVRLRGEVVDDAGIAVGAALVACREVGLRGRTWSAFADPVGRFALDAAATPLSCSVTPPESRPDLALTRTSVDPLNPPERLPVTRGARLLGSVRFEGRPEPFALVEVQDPTGRVWGSALTDERGEFSLRANPNPVAR